MVNWSGPVHNISFKIVDIATGMKIYPYKEQMLYGNSRKHSSHQTEKIGSYSNPDSLSNVLTHLQYYYHEQIFPFFPDDRIFLCGMSVKLWQLPHAELSKQCHKNKID